jgi:hypothetical protein
VTEIANPGHYAFDFVVGKIEEKWENALKTHLGKYGRYQRVCFCLILFNLDISDTNPLPRELI